MATLPVEEKTKRTFTSCNFPFLFLLGFGLWVGPAICFFSCVSVDIGPVLHFFLQEHFFIFLSSPESACLSLARLNLFHSEIKKDEVRRVTSTHW